MTKKNAPIAAVDTALEALARPRLRQRLRYGVRGVIRPRTTAAQEQFQRNVATFAKDQQFLLWLLAAGLGPAIAYAAICFRLLIGYVQWPWLFTTSERIVAAANLVPWWTIVMAPTLGAVVVGYVLDHYMPGKRARSVADVIEARALLDSRIDPKSGLLSALLAAFSLGCGASAGREGPVVHLGATLSSWLSSKVNLSRPARRTLLAAGVAAAISASFNAPIAGILFAHEVILQHYAMRAFIPIVIASVAAGIVARLHFGNFPAFIIPDYEIASFFEFPAFVILGCVCALVAILFQVAVRLTEGVVWKFEMPLWLRSGGGGFAVGIIALAFPEVLGVGYAATDQALLQKFSLSLLLMLIVAKTAATAITLACRFSVGVFSPALYLGAMTGAAFGIIATSIGPENASSASLYAILGMGGVAAAVLGAPISTTMIVFELTGGFSMSIALLVTISIASGLTHACLGQSYFHWQLKKRGMLLQEGPHRAILRQTKVASFMSPVAEGEERRNADNAQDPALYADDTLEHALRVFTRVGAASLPVVSADDPLHVIGKAQRVTALSAYNKALVDAHVEEHQ